VSARLPARASRWRRATVEARYAGSTRVAPGTYALVVLRRR
jgi:hypothetical protein